MLMIHFYYKKKTGVRRLPVLGWGGQNLVLTGAIGGAGRWPQAISKLLGCLAPVVPPLLQCL